MAKKKQADLPFYLAVAVGLGLVVFPEPVTTATGLAILAATFGARALD